MVTSDQNVLHREAGFPDGLSTELTVPGANSVDGVIFIGGMLPELKRLIVLVDTLQIADADFARRIWGIASPAHVNVLFLALAQNDDEVLMAERRLTSLAAITRDCWVHVTTKVYCGRNWISAIQSVLEPGDMIACHTEQTVSDGLFRQPKPLTENILSTLQAPVYQFSGMLSPKRPGWKRQILLVPYWLSFLLIITVFFFLEARVTRVRQGWMEEIIVALIFIIELGVLWAWNSIQL